MDLIWTRSTNLLTVGDTTIRAWSQVRNELNAQRPRANQTDVFHITREDGSQGPAAMPRPFPIGDWHITGIIPHPDPVKDEYLYPFFIATDAWQNLQIWELDGRGFYMNPTGVYEADYAYGLHFSTSYTTVGCLRIDTEAHVRWLASNVKYGDSFRVVD